MSNDCTLGCSEIFPQFSNFIYFFPKGYRWHVDSLTDVAVIRFWINMTFYCIHSKTLHFSFESNENVFWGNLHNVSLQSTTETYYSTKTVLQKGHKFQSFTWNACYLLKTEKTECIKEMHYGSVVLNLFKFA